MKIQKEEFIMKEWTNKDLRRAAFAVGFGLYFGKEVAKFIDETVSKTIVEVVKVLAKDGNKHCQNLCERNGVNYEEKPKKDDNEIKMGFHM